MQFMLKQTIQLLSVKLLDKIRYPHFISMWNMWTYWAYSVPACMAWNEFWGTVYIWFVIFRPVSCSPLTWYLLPQGLQRCLIWKHCLHNTSQTVIRTGWLFARWDGTWGVSFCKERKAMLNNVKPCEHQLHEKCINNLLLVLPTRMMRLHLKGLG